VTRDFPWPIPPGSTVDPVWTGRGFQLGDQRVSILCYDESSPNWTDELTTFHEQSAGSDHFIDLASRAHAVDQVRRSVPGAEPVILEVGCSSGFLLKDLRKSLPYALLIGSDCVRQPLERLAQDLPDLPLLFFDLVNCPLADNSVDAVVLLNVLEHIENHEAAAQQLYRILRPGGVAVIEVPAGPQLYDVYDKVLMHCRRYTLRELVTLVQAVGFRVVDRSHLGFFLYPGFRWVKKRNQRYLSEPPEVQRELVEKNIQSIGSNRLLHALMRFELALGRLIRYPWGIRCLITAVKTPDATAGSANRGSDNEVPGRN
jgi:SAM-dependent methyltransferase